MTNEKFNNTNEEEMVTINFKSFDESKKEMNDFYEERNDKDMIAKVKNMINAQKKAETLNFKYNTKR